MNKALKKQRKSKPEPRQIFYNSFNDEVHILSDFSHFEAKTVVKRAPPPPPPPFIWKSMT